MEKIKQILPALPGFEKIKRYWDAKHHMVAAKILPGEYYVTQHQELISTVLGSCVSACIRDPKNKIGGMNHFMLPLNRGGDSSNKKQLEEATYYGQWAMEHLINEILKNGGKRENLEIKIFGGGTVVKEILHTNVGNKNIDFVREYLAIEKLPIAAEDVGDIYPRKILYYPTTGKVYVLKIKRSNAVINQREKNYLAGLQKTPIGGEVELFDAPSARANKSG